MNLNKYTEKSREALQAAHDVALRLNHQEMRPLHLLFAIVDQPEGLGGGAAQGPAR